MKWIEILRKGNYALLQSESDTQYVVASGYDPTQPEGQQWGHGTYFCYYKSDEKAEYLQMALDCFRKKTEENYNYISIGRLVELASRFKDCIDGDEDMENVIDDMEDYELDFFGIEREVQD